MPLEFYQKDGKLLELAASVIQVPERSHLPGSQITRYVHGNGTFTIQELAEEQFTVRFNLFDFIKKVSMVIRDENRGLRSFLAFKNSLKFQTTFATVNLREGQYCMLPDTTMDRLCYFSSGKQYGSFDTIYSEELLSRLPEAFDWKNLAGSRTNAWNLFAKGNTRWAHPHMHDIVRNLLHCDYDAPLRRFYIDTKIREYLFLMLVGYKSSVPAISELTINETASIYEAQKLILENLDHHFTIQQISRKVHINEFKLKIAFKKIFGTGIFETLLNARMEKAHILLLETDKPIKEIAGITGYEHVTSFITAFRKHFGFTPGSLRRK